MEGEAAYMIGNVLLALLGLGLICTGACILIYVHGQQEGGD